MTPKWNEEQIGFIKRWVDPQNGFCRPNGTINWPKVKQLEPGVWASLSAGRSNPDRDIQQRASKLRIAMSGRVHKPRAGKVKAPKQKASPPEFATHSNGLANSPSIKFCPSCGCNLVGIFAAMRLAERLAK